MSVTDETYLKLKVKGLEQRILKLEEALMAIRGEQLRQKIAKQKAIEAAQAKKEAKRAAAEKQLSLI